MANLIIVNTAVLQRNLGLAAQHYAFTRRHLHVASAMLSRSTVGESIQERTVIILIAVNTGVFFCGVGDIPIDPVNECWTTAVPIITTTTAAGVIFFLNVRVLETVFGA